MILRHVSEVSTKSLRLSLVTMIPSVFSARWSRNLWGGPERGGSERDGQVGSSAHGPRRRSWEDLSSCEEILWPQTSLEGVKDSSRRSSSWFRKCCSGDDSSARVRPRDGGAGTTRRPTCGETVPLLTPLRDKDGDVPVAPPPEGLHSQRDPPAGEEAVETVTVDQQRTGRVGTGETGGSAVPQDTSPPTADSRHGHVAAVDDDVPEVRRARLVGQLQGVGGPQRLVEAGQAGHRGRSLVGGRGLPSELGMADGLVRRGRGSGEGRSCLGRSTRTAVSRWAEEGGGGDGGGGGMLTLAALSHCGVLRSAITLSTFTDPPSV